MNKYKGIIFDLDGTLLDSSHIWLTLASDLLADMGIIDKDIDEELCAKSIDEAISYIIAKHNLEYTPEYVKNKVFDMIDHAYKNEVKLKKGAKDVLIELKNKGIKLGIATAGDKNKSEICLKNNGVLDYFDVFYTCDELATSKRESLIFDHCTRDMGLNKEEVLVVEDAYYSINTLNKYGYATVLVYNFNEEEFIKLSKMATYSIRDFSEFFSKIKS